MHRFSVIEKFGIMYGVLIYLRKNEILAFSVTAFERKGSRVFENTKEARFYLYKLMIQAGEKTKIGLTKYSETFFKYYPRIERKVI